MVSSRRVVITGVGIVSPLGACANEYWKQLIDGDSGIGPLTRFDSNRFSSRLAAEVDDADVDIKEGLYTHEITRMDRFVRYAISAADDALIDSGILSSKNSSVNGCLYVGVGMGGLPHMENGVIRQETRGPRRISPYLIPSLIPNMAASVIALRYEIKGPQYTIAGSCASGSQAIGQAMQSIRNGNFIWALAGGTEAVVTPITFSGFEAMRALSTAVDSDSQPRPFDQHRDGMIIGEGAAIFVLEERTHAESRGAKIYAELIGYATCSGSIHIALQSTSDMMNCIKLALLDAKLKVSDVDCIYAQASGMKKGDECELHVFQMMFRKQDMPSAITSIKGHLGHSFAASGPLNLVAALGTLREQIIPPTLNLEVVEPGHSNINIVRQSLSRRIRNCLINSFGFGGINASLIVSKYPRQHSY